MSLSPSRVNSGCHPAPALRTPTNTLLLPPLQTAPNLPLSSPRSPLTPYPPRPCSFFPPPSGFILDTPVYPAIRRQCTPRCALSHASLQSNWRYHTPPRGRSFRSGTFFPHPSPTRKQPRLPPSRALRKGSLWYLPRVRRRRAARRAWRSAAQSARVMATRRRARAARPGRAAARAARAAEFPGARKGSAARHPFEVCGWLYSALASPSPCLPHPPPPRLAVRGGSSHWPAAGLAGAGGWGSARQSPPCRLRPWALRQLPGAWRCPAGGQRRLVGEAVRSPRGGAGMGRGGIRKMVGWRGVPRTGCAESQDWVR